MLKNYECIMQDSNYDCGVSSLLTVFSTIGIKASKEELRTITKINNNGVSAYNLIEACKHYGLKAQGVKASINDLKCKMPIIAHVIVNNMLHYIVIHEINYKKKKLIVADPALGLKEMGFDEFLSISTNIFIIFEIDKIKSIRDKRFINYLKSVISEHKKSLISCVVLSCISIFLTILITYYLKIVLDLKNMFHLFLITPFFLIVVLIKNIINKIRIKRINNLSVKIDKKLTLNIYRHILLLPYSYYQMRPMGEFISIINDISIFKEVIFEIIVVLFIDLLLIIISLLFIVFTNYLYLLFFVFLLVCYWLFYKIFKRNFVLVLNSLKLKGINLSNKIVEVLSSFESIKNLNIYKTITNKLKEHYNAYENEVMNYNNKYLLKEKFRNLVGDIFQIVLIFVSFILTFYNKISISDLVLINSLFNVVITSCSNILDSVLLIDEKKVSINRVMDVLDVEEEKIKEQKSFDIKNIRFANVELKFDNNTIFKNLSLEIKKGEKILLTGSSGVGKSSLIKSLLKYISLDEGKIYLDNIDIENMNLVNIRENITYVSQNESLFNDSVKNNIVLNDFDEKRFNRIIKLCKVSDILNKNNITSDYLLNDDASNLSGGEKKRIILARALYKNSNIYIFDETFNEIDIMMEKEILSNVFKKFKDKTIIVISHRKNNMDLFDKIINIEKGGIKIEKNDK